jgi:hypothetical protein
MIFYVLDNSTGNACSDGAKLLEFFHDAVTKAVDGVEQTNHHPTEEGMSDFLMYPLDIQGSKLTIRLFDFFSREQFVCWIRGKCNW